MSYKILDLKAFVNDIERNPKPINRFTWLIGAGFSSSAGVPLAQEVCHILTIYEYIGEHRLQYKDVLSGFGYNGVDLQNYFKWYFKVKEDKAQYKNVLENAYSWLRTIEQFANVSSDKPESYQVLFEHLLIGNDKHHIFLTNLIQLEKGVNVAHIGLAGLLKKFPEWGHTVFTTNFDDLLLKSILSLNHTARIFGELIVSENERISTSPTYPQIVHLHGRHTGYRLLNTKDQITNKYSDILKKEFLRHIGDSNLIVVGYSGWDDMIMQTLKDWNEQNYQLISGNLYWIPYKDESTIDARVLEFLSKCPDNKTFLINTKKKNLDADLFILELCNSINKASGGFSEYRNEVLKAAQKQHDFIFSQLKDYSAFSPNKALEIIDKVEQNLKEENNPNFVESLQEAYDIISVPDIPNNLQAKMKKKLGFLYYKLGNFKIAKEILTNSLELFLQLNENTIDTKSEISENRRLLTELYINNNDFIKATSLIEEAIYLDKQILKNEPNDSAETNLVLSRICRIYIQMLIGNYLMIDVDIAEVEKKIKYIESNNKAVGKFHQIKACLSMSYGKLDDAAKNFSISTQHFSKVNDQQNMALNQVYEASILIKQKDLELAQNVITKAYSHFSAQQDIIGVAICKNVFGQYEFLDGKSQNAIEYFNESITTLEQNNSLYNLINVLVDKNICLKKDSKIEEQKVVTSQLDNLNYIKNQYYKKSTK